jgi:hypothetical protein
MSGKGEDVMELTVLMTALQREVEKRHAVDEAAAKLARALGMEAHEQGLQAIEKSMRDIGADRIARRLRSINSTHESDEAPTTGEASAQEGPEQDGDGRPAPQEGLRRQPP